MKILKYSILTFAVAVFATGCIKETFPMGGSVTEDQIASSDEPLMAKIGALTASLSSINVAGYYSGYGQHNDFGLPSIHVMTDIMLGDMTACGNANYNLYWTYSSNQAMGSSYIYCGYFWRCYYSWIAAANAVISSVSNPDTADAASRLALGQAYAYRAMCYLDLARLYEAKPNRYTDVTAVAGLTVPIVDENTTESEGQNNPRVPREKMYEFILEDLARAETYLGGEEGSANAPYTSAVYGLYARTYIEMAYWEEQDSREMFAEAQKYAELAISASGRTPLTQAEWEDPSKGFNSSSSNNSWIWGLPLVGENVNNVSSFPTFMASEARWAYGVRVQYGASKAFYEKVNDADFRKHSWLDPDWVKSKGVSGYQYKLAGSADEQTDFIYGTAYYPAAAAYTNIKFRPGQGQVNDYNVGGVADHPVMRVEEMYFIRMEAMAGQGNLSAAKSALNEFMRYRVTDGSYNCAAVAGSEKGFLKEMLFQKRVEFWGEGIVFYDYKRLDMGITRKYDGSNYSSNEQFNTNGRSPQWNIVIPRNELNSNDGIPESLCNPDPSEKIPF